jgi:hypothetical protein
MRLLDLAVAIGNAVKHCFPVVIGVVSLVGEGNKKSQIPPNTI